MKKLAVFIICVAGCLLLGAQNQPVDTGSSVTFGSVAMAAANIGNAFVTNTLTAATGNISTLAANTIKMTNGAALGAIPVSDASGNFVLSTTPSFSGVNISTLASSALVGALPAIDGSALTGLNGANVRTNSLLANSFSFSGTGAASALTNYTCAFSGTNFLKVVATTNVIFSSFTGGAGNVSYKVVASGGNWTIGWPTNLVTYNTNLLTVAGTNWTFTLTNGHTFRGSFNVDTNLTSNPSYTNIDMGWAFSP